MNSVKEIMTNKLTLKEGTALSFFGLIIILIHLGLFVENPIVKGTSVVLFAAIYVVGPIILALLRRRS